LLGNTTFSSIGGSKLEERNREVRKREGDSGKLGRPAKLKRFKKGTVLMRSVSRKRRGGGKKRG